MLVAVLPAAVAYGLFTLWMAAQGGQPWAMSLYSPGATLAGAISSATHGAEFRWPLLIDTVKAVHMVGPGGHHPLPAEASFARAAGRAGIAADTFVVAYGALGGAERLWWLLRHCGHDDCAVIDFEAWLGPLTAGIVAVCVGASTGAEAMTAATIGTGTGRA